MKKRFLSTLAAAILTSTLILSSAGCGNQSSSIATGSSSAISSSLADTSTAANSVASSTGELSEEHKAELQAKFDALKGVPKFTYQAEVFDAKTAMAGKKWLTIPGTSANPFNETICGAMTEVVAMIGFKEDLYENQGAAEEHISALDSAKQQGYSLVDLQAGPTPQTLGAQIQNCIDNGIFVVTSHLTDYGQKVSPISSNMGADYIGAGSLLADWAILHAGVNAKVLVPVSEEITSTAAMEEGIKAEFAKYAPNGKVDFVNVAIVDWGTKMQSEVENYLSAHPDTNYVLPIYDSMNQYVVPAVASTGSKAKIASYNGTPFAVDYVNDGKVEMIVGEDLSAIAYATVDYEMRTQLGMKLVDEPTMFRIWTKDNVAQALDDKGKCQYGIGYGDAYITGYKTLWGIK
ncbi:MAG: sugar ABC transporter substrate-binding protein [Ruminiclostridium sp.]